VHRAGLSNGTGLIRKQFIYAEDGWAGGVYLWKTRADAEAFYSVSEPMTSSGVMSDPFGLPLEPDIPGGRSVHAAAGQIGAAKVSLVEDSAKSPQSADWRP
jgi:hypothetical protein